MSVPCKAYDFLIEPLRDEDRKRGAQFLERYFDGIQSVWGSINSKIFSIPDLWSVVNCPDEFLQYLKLIVGWTSDLDYITESLSYDELRRLLSISIQLWKTRSTEDSVVDVLFFATAARNRIFNYFYFRMLLGENYIDESRESGDSWGIYLPESEDDVGDSTMLSCLRIVDNGTLNRDLVINLLKLMRPIGERLEVVYLGFLDEFKTSGDNSQWTTDEINPSVADGIMILSNVGSLSPLKTMVTTGQTWSQASLTIRVKQNAVVNQSVFAMIMLYTDDSHFYRIEMIVRQADAATGKSSIRIVKALTFPGESQLAQFYSPPCTMDEDVWYTIRAVIVNESTGKRITVYIDGTEIGTVYDPSPHPAGNIGISITDESAEIDEVELIALPVETDFIGIGE